MQVLPQVVFEHRHLPPLHSGVPPGQGLWRPTRPWRRIFPAHRRHGRSVSSRARIPLRIVSDAGKLASAALVPLAVSAASLQGAVYAAFVGRDAGAPALSFLQAA
jgi:hypothetical protein